MLPPENRITKNTDISAIKKNGQKINTRHIIIYYLPGKSPLPRFAFVVGKHVHKSAVARHRYQRWMRNIAKSIIPRLSQPFNMVWVARPSINQTLRQQQIFNDVEAGLKHRQLISRLPPAS